MRFLQTGFLPSVSYQSRKLRTLLRFELSSLGCLQGCRYTGQNEECSRLQIPEGTSDSQVRRGMVSDALRLCRRMDQTEHGRRRKEILNTDYGYNRSKRETVA